MKKLMIIAALAAAGTVFADTTAVTNALDVYDFKASVQTPVTKYDKKTGVYKVYETRKLQGYFTVTWVTEYEGGIEVRSYGIPGVTLWNSSDKSKAVVPFDVVPMGGDFSLMGKKMNVSSVCFTIVDRDVGPESAGFKSLAFAGKGGVKDYKVATVVCKPCGITDTAKVVCRKVYSLSGNAVGLYSCGCGAESPSCEVAECGYDEDEATPINGCWGTWSAKYNAKLSETYDDAL